LVLAKEGPQKSAKILPKEGHIQAKLIIIFKTKGEKLAATRKEQEKKFKCPVQTCDKSFATKANLGQHANFHSALKQYKCDQCGKLFKFDTSLRGHKISHIGAHSSAEEQAMQAHWMARNRALQRARRRRTKKVGSSK